jgi:hypothetical protein
MAINLNIDFEIDEDQLWSWIDMGDDKVCPDCGRLAALPPRKMSEWETEPGRGDTVCGDHCRCLFFPEGLLEIYPDLKTEGKINIDDGLLIGEVENMNTSYETFAELDALIGQYKDVTGGLKLPPEYYAINNVNKRIEFLNNWLEEN